MSVKTRRHTYTQTLTCVINVYFRNHEFIAYLHVPSTCTGFLLASSVLYLGGPPSTVKTLAPDISTFMSLLRLELHLKQTRIACPAAKKPITKSSVFLCSFFPPPCAPRPQAPPSAENWGCIVRIVKILCLLITWILWLWKFSSHDLSLLPPPPYLREVTSSFVFLVCLSCVFCFIKINRYLYVYFPFFLRWNVAQCVFLKASYYF